MCSPSVISTLTAGTPAASAARPAAKSEMSYRTTSGCQRSIARRKCGYEAVVSMRMKTSLTTRALASSGSICRASAKIWSRSPAGGSGIG